MKNKDKTLFTLLREYGESDFYPYHMPGHKRKGQGDFDERILGIDITEIDGFDNLHQPNGILLDCQRRAADLYSADESFFLINGSTCGILSAISAALPVGGHILMARGSHKSAYHAAYLRKLKITYIYSDINEKFDICEAVKAADIEKLLDENTDIDAVYIVSPTYEGRIADVGAIAETVHKRGIPLIVDEAHGAHLGFADGFAKNSCQLNADIVIHSVHKTLPAMTQTALLHVNGSIIDRDRLRRFLRIYQSSSPSYILMAGIDNTMQMIENEGRKLFADFRDEYIKMTEALGRCSNLEFILPHKGQDIGKLVISGKKSGISGLKIYDILRDRYHLQSEMASAGFCLAMFTVCDTKEAYERMFKALTEVDREAYIYGDCTLKDYGVAKLMGQAGGRAILLSDAWDMDFEEIELCEAAGRISKEFINLYPPGIPLLVPGESISERHCLFIREYIDNGLNVQGVFVHGDASDKYCVRVLKKFKQ